MRTCRTTLLPILILMALWAFTTASAQNRETNVWYFGTRAGLDFNIPPAALTSPAEITTSLMDASEGSAVMTDRTTGQLLFYTNGIQIWDRTNTPMPNATGANLLGGGPSSTQAVLVVPDPGNTSRYYVFTSPDLGGTTGEFSIVDMTLRGGLGDVVLRRQTLPPIPGEAPLGATCEKLAGTLDAAGTGYWVLFHQFNSNAFYAYHISGTGIDAGLVSRTGTSITGQTAFARGEMKFSPDGQWLATSNEFLVMELFRFNNATGGVSFAAGLDSDHTYGVSFSPNSRLLYVNTGWQDSGRTIYQFNLDGPVGGIRGTRVIIGTDPDGGLGGMQIAPDGRIYVAKFPEITLGAINCPNVPGTASTYVPNAFTFTGSRRSTWGLPNLILESVATPQFAGRDTAVCLGSTARIGIPTRPGFTYSWAPVTGLANPNSSTTDANPTVTTTYTLAVTNPFGCIDTDAVVVTVNPVPAVSVAGDSVICAGDPTTLDVSVQAGEVVTWSPATGLNTTSGPTVIANPAATTTYTVSITNATSCTSTSEVTVTVNPVPPLTVTSQNLAICAGDSVRLGASSTASGATFLWSPAAGLDNPASQNPMASPDTTTAYSVTVTDGNGCDSAATVNVTVNPLPVAGVSRDTALCAGESVQLQASGGTIFRWSPGVGLSDSSIQNPVAAPLNTTSYQVIIENSSGCADTAQVTLTVNPLPIVTARAGDSQICRGRSTLLTGTGSGTFLWSPATGLSDSTSPTPTASPLTTTTYTLTVTNAAGCDTSASVTVVVVDPPARFRLPDTLIGPNQRGVRIPIARNLSGLPPLCRPDTLVMEISFNATLFLPTRVTFGTVSRSQVVGGRRIVTILFTPSSPFDTGAVLTTLIGDALLGDAIITDMTFDSVAWDGVDVTSLSQNGSLRTDSICSFFGDRLLNYRSGFAITKVAPNPTSRGTQVEVQTVGPDEVQLELYGAGGERIFSRSWTPTVGGIEEVRIVEMALPDDLPSGLYHLVLHSAGMRDSKQLIIIR